MPFVTEECTNTNFLKTSIRQFPESCNKLLKGAINP